MRPFISFGWPAIFAVAIFAAASGCSASGDIGVQPTGGAGGQGAGSGGGISGFGGADTCGACNGTSYTSCDSGEPETIQCPKSCTPDVGCTACSPMGTLCVGNEVHSCTGNGEAGALITTCDAAAGEVCNNGECKDGCRLAEEQPSNLGCEFYAVDLDLQDPTNPAAKPWALVLANAGQVPADVVIEKTDTPFGQPPSPTAVFSTTVPPGELVEYPMPTREVDCSAVPGQGDAPGTCLSRNAFRVTSTVPIVIYQFNNNIHGFSTDASLLLPTTSVGRTYRVVGWGSAHPYADPLLKNPMRTYVTIVGTETNTTVTVKPSYRIRGSGNLIPPIAAGETFTATIGPFEVLNLETDNATLQECVAMQTAPYCTDLTGTAVEADKPIVVFSGTEQSGVGLPEGAPEPPSWDDNKGCCNQHLEEQLAPVESYGKKFLITRSPVRSNSEFTSWVEPDVLRFVGAAEQAQVTTTLPAPYDSFTLAPGQVIDTWTQTDVIVTSTQPIVVAQFLVAQDYVEPQPKGDPSFTIFPPVEQSRTEYVFLSPSEWPENWVVIGTEKGNVVSIDGSVPSDCIVADVGELDGKQYEARRCPLAAGAHRLTGTEPYQVMAYGYASADTYAFPGGANIKKIYEPPTVF